MFRQISILLLVALMALPGFAQEAGIQIFQDNFDTYATFAENWIPIKGSSRIVKPDAMQILFPRAGYLTMRRETPLNFYVEMDVSMDMSHQEDPKTWGSASCGFLIDNFSFLVMPSGRTWMIYKLPEWKNSEGQMVKIDGFELGKPIKLAVIRQIKKGRATYTFRINDKLAGYFSCNAPKPNKNASGREVYKPLEIFTRNVNMRIDNFILSTVKDSADASPNTVINSSFEHALDGFPIFYCRMPSAAVFESLGTTPYEEYTSLWQLDTLEKHSGKQSLKMITNKVSDYQSLFAWGAGTVKDLAGVFSVWMKADKEDFPVWISYGKRKEVKVGTTWKRYEVVNPKLPGGGPYSPVTITVNKVKGTLWVDDLQAELIDDVNEAELKSDKTFATPYKVSVLDKEKFTVQKVEKPVRAPEFTIPKLSAGIMPTVLLDAWKNKAVKLDTFYYNGGKKPTNKTDAYLACDYENLYIGYRCFVKEFPKDTIKKDNRDGFGIFARDSVEMLLDPKANGKYYQLATDTAGNQVDISVAEGSAWNGDWKTESKLNSALKSVDYLVTIPFANFTSANMKPRWSLNICRNDISIGFQQMSIAKKGFKDTAYWAFANLPEDVVKAYAFGITEGSYSNTKDGCSIALKVSNSTGTPLKLKAELLDASNNSGLIGSRQITLKKGMNDIVFDLKIKTNKVTLKLTENDKQVLAQTIRLEKSDLVSMLGRLSFYMNEPEAVFKVETTLSEPETLSAILTVNGQKVEQKASADFKIALPLKNIANGTYDVTLSLQKNGKIIASTSTKLIKRPYKAGACQINHFSRSLIHEGKPIVPFTPFIDTGRKTVKTMTSIIDYLHRNGFQFLHILFDQRVKDKDAVEILKHVNEKGIKLTLWTAIGQLPENKWDEYLKVLDFPCVTSLMVLDEPEIRGMKSEEAKVLLEKVRKKTPYLPVTMNNTSIGIPARYADLHTDILGLDDYLSNSQNRTVESVLRNADIMWEAGKDKAKPCMFFLVGGNFPLHYREPTYAEQIAQTYGALASGCVSFSYFYGIVQTEGNWKAMKQLNQEILSLTDVICSEEEVGASSCSVVNTADAKLRHRTKKYNGYVYVISVNTGKNPMDKVTFTLPAEFKYDGNVEVMFENRKLTQKDGKFTDDFAGHFRHVYKIKIN